MAKPRSIHSDSLDTTHEDNVLQSFCPSLEASVDSQILQERDMYSTTGRPLRPSSQPTTTSIMDRALIVRDSKESVGCTISPEHPGLREMNDDDIVDAAVLTFGERRKKFSHVFNLSQAFHKSRGDLLSKYRYLKPRVDERKALLEDHRSHPLPRKEASPRHGQSKKRSSKNVEPKLGFEVPDSSATMEGLSRTLQSIGDSLSQATKSCDSQRPPKRSSKNVEPKSHFAVPDSSAAIEASSRTLQSNGDSLSQATKPCDPQRPPEKVLCSGEACPKKWWTGADLQEYFGAELQSVREIEQRHGHWFCLLCSFKAHTRPATQVLSLPAPLNPLETLNCDTGWLEDDSIREPLNLLKGAMVQYLSMARRKLLSFTSKSSMRILDVPFIENEITTRDTAPVPPLTKAMRKLLDVPAAVLIKDKLVGEKLENTDFSIWICGALAAFVTDFIFGDDSPFEDDTLWRKTLMETGRTPEHADLIIQAHRIHCIKAFKSPNEAGKPKYLSERINNQHQAFIERLNTAMMPLVSGDTEVQGHHKRIATHSRDLKLITSTYRGTFEAIRPNIRTPLDPTLHSLENPASDVDKEELAGQRVMVTTLPGIKFMLPGGGWRVCAEALVHLWPKCEPVMRIPPQLVILHHNSQVPKKRKVGSKSYPGL